MNEVLFLSDINITEYILIGLKFGFIFSLGTGFFSLGLNYCLKLLFDRG